jgi:hypothetical protein
MGRRIAALANEPKRFAEFQEGGHSNLYVDGNDALPVVREWIRGLAR